MAKLELELFKDRSMSGFLIFFYRLLHLVSKLQKITARTSTEYEIYVTDECVKELLRVCFIILDLNFFIYNYQLNIPPPFILIIWPVNNGICLHVPNA